MNARALVIMAKAPELGKVKTRLRGALDDGDLLRLYENLLCATVGKLRAVAGVDTYLTYFPPEARGYFEEFGLPSFPQAGEDLGERMLRALSHVLSLGHERAVLVGVDIPGLGSREVTEALALLDESDVVFCPATDGGYYLVGMKTLHPEVFRDVGWSEPTTLLQSLDRAESAGLSVALGAELSDLDRPEDLPHAGLL